MNSVPLPTRNTYAGLFTVSLSTLAYEILLPRIFSVTMWYHFAFMAVSVAMFGMTVGAIAVYLWPDYFAREQTKRHLVLASTLFAASIVVSFLTHLSIPFLESTSLVGLYSIAFTYAVLSIPFFFSGICVCLSLVRFPEQVSKLYAADLAGAALGCILLIYMIELTDGPTAVVVVAGVAGAGAVFFAGDLNDRLLRRIAVGLTLALACFAVLNTALSKKGRPWLRLVWIRGVFQASAPLFEKWNSFSRVTVSGHPDELSPPFGWGLSPTFHTAPRFRLLYMLIDQGAGTVLTFFDGDVQKLDHLKFDITNLAHYIRPHADVLVVGTGGGRDILSALAFEQKSVLGIEINRQIIGAVNGRFGDFTGHLDRNPRVKFVNDEARSYIARMPGAVDLIQLSLVDTAAATTAGAFVLTENPLYTVEGWTTFLEHLNPHGILTVSRWYVPALPAEIYRLTSLARSALLEFGVANPRAHIMLAVAPPAGAGHEATVGTILVSKQPFSDEDIQATAKVTERMKFDLLLSPSNARDPNLAYIASGHNMDLLSRGLRLNISAPTDDRPFFFNMLRFRDVLDRELWQGASSFNTKAVAVLALLLVVVVGLTVLCIIQPLLLAADRSALRGASALVFFFTGIGFGFMLIEISQLQRLIVFLGHQTYSLSVVLFSLLLASSLGSYLTRGVQDSGVRSSGVRRLLALLGILVAFGLLTPQATLAFRSAQTEVRIIVAVMILLPLGLFMGMAFPLGIKVGASRAAAITPWLWGINGASSVCASVVAVAIAMSWGISASFWTGFACYAIALLAFVLATRPLSDAPRPTAI